MSEALLNLRQQIREYRDLDNELRALNSQVNDRRTKRRDVENRMSELLKREEFKDVEKLRIEDDNSMVQVKHPLSYSKPWGLSKKELKTHLTNLFERMGGHANAEECYDWIVAEQSKKLVSTEFEFNRVVK
jgi:hypothetical protein